MSDYCILEANELFRFAKNKMRYKQVRILRKVQACMSYGGWYNGQFKEKEERNGVYSLFWVCEELSQKRFVIERS